MARAADAPSSFPLSLAGAFEINDRITRYLIKNLSNEAWTAKPPDGKGRTVAAIVAHIHNVRVMLARQVGHPLPPKAIFGMWEWGSRGKD